MPFSTSKKILLIVSLGFGPVGLVLVWAGYWWHRNAGDFFGLSYVQYVYFHCVPEGSQLRYENLEDRDKDGKSNSDQ
jgi:hypothetical protein